MFSNLKYTLRQFAKSPGFTAVAVLTLALGIGGNTAIFSLFDAVALRGVPGIKYPDNLVIASRVGPQVTPDNMYGFSYPFFVQLRGEARSLADVAATSTKGSARTLVASGLGSNQVETVQANYVSGNFFSFLGLPAVLGRTLTPEDDRPGDPRPAAVLSFAYWQNRFSSDPDVVGKALRIEDVAFTIVGVAPPGFTGMYRGANADLWVPIQMVTQIDPADLGQRLKSPFANNWVNIMGRRQQGVSQAKARAEMEVVYQRSQADVVAAAGGHLSAEFQKYFLGDHVELEPGGSGYTGFQLFKPILAIVMTITVLVLLVACANVASLLLARGTARQRELAVRLALGAGRRRLITQLVTESTILALAGGALGLVFAQWGIPVLSGYLPSYFNNINLSPDIRVLLFLAAVSVFTGILAGLIPAIHFSRLDLMTVLKNQTQGVTSSRQRINRTLVTAQIAASVCLIAGAGLFVRTLQKLRDVDPGFEHRSVLLTWVVFDKRYDANRRTDLFKRSLVELRRLPGVGSASLAVGGLASGGGTVTAGLNVEGYTPAPGDSMVVYTTAAGPDFFSVLGVPILEGRPLADRDMFAAYPPTEHGANIPAVISETFAQRYFRPADPIGRRFRTSQGGPRQFYEVVGVARDVKYHDLREMTLPEVYVPYAASPPPAIGTMTFQMRTTGSPASFAASVPAAIQRVDPNARVIAMRTMDDILDRSLLNERAIAQIASFFGLLALALACIGLYGVLAYNVAQRTHEIGVRMALGASAGDILGLIVRQGVTLSLGGCALGMMAAYGLVRLVGSRLYGVGGADPLTFLGTAILLMLVALFASWLPARRATKVDPLVALRAE
ncbi:MAG: ABC transporter permease [Opitutaceae bacterium]